MACNGTELYIGLGIALVSEALPFVRRYLKWNIPADGIVWLFACLLFRSKCMTQEQVREAEHLLGKDIDGDGYIGTPPQLSPANSVVVSDGAK